MVFISKNLMNGQLAIMPEVLTLDEVADYLRLPKAIVEAQISQAKMPGRRIADTWRFLKSAIDEWLRGQDQRAELVADLAEDEISWALVENERAYRQKHPDEVITCHSAAEVMAFLDGDA